MMAAVPQIVDANFKAAVTEWCERDAWLEARNTAAKLGLSDAIEAELRQFLVSEHAKETDKLGSGDEKADRAARRREGDARCDAWFARISRKPKTSHSPRSSLHWH
jgi:hypothetical protein